MITTQAPTHEIKIYTTGSLEQVKQICREYCKEVGLCVTVTPTLFIYTGGEETGVEVGLRNYPRFPTNSTKLMGTASALAEKLLKGLCQNSIMLTDSLGNTTWYTLREENAPNNNS